MNINEVMETFDYAFTSGSKYGWDCYPFAQYAIFSSDWAEVSVIFSIIDQTIYEITVDIFNSKWDKEVADSFRPYRWINPEWRDEYIDESESRGYDYRVAWDDVTYIDLDVDTDFLDKAKAIFNGEYDFDKRIVIPIDISDADFCFHAKKAHEMDITFNEYINYCLEQSLKFSEKD